MRAPPPAPLVAALVLALALLGAGSKAGLVPLHVWLPLAHPAAPSHVSALMSGVMTKVAIYGFIRIVFDLLGPAGLVVGHVVHGRWAARPPSLGVLYALMQTRSQAPARLFARSRTSASSSSALGLALAFKANGMARPRRWRMTAALLHVAQPFPVQEPAVLRRRRGADARPASATWSGWAA